MRLSVEQSKILKITGVGVAKVGPVVGGPERVTR